MSRSKTWRQHAAGLIYEAYPDQDLLPIDPPQPGETIRAFAQRAEEAGDTLFLFLCREAGDDCAGAAEYVARLDRAIDDLKEVRTALARTSRRWEDHAATNRVNNECSRTKAGTPDSRGVPAQAQ